MKKQILLIVLILLSNNIRAQITSGVDSVFGSLDTSEMNTDLLYDKGFNSEFYKNYNGSNDQSCSFNNWQQLYSGIFFGQMNLVRSLPTLQEVMQQARDYHKENADVLPLLILNYKYDVFKSNVFEDNLIAIQNGVFLDQPSTESPYEEGRFFASAAISNRIRSLQMKYFIGSEFYFTNDEEIPLSIEIDFDDGIGYRNVNFNQTITVNYIDTQSKTIKVKFNYASKNYIASNILSSSDCVINPPSIDHTEVIQASIPHLGSYGKLNAYIRYGSGHPGVIRKPIIIVEGIDFGTLNDANQKGDFGWCALWGNSMIYPELTNMPVLLSELSSRGYDIILADFYDGADYIERNAFALVKLIEYINSRPEVKEPSVVIGASMGGQVAKYALSYMEQNDMPHCTREYLSFDSPQQGANIPLGLQYSLKFLSDWGNAGAQDQIQTKLNRPATRQLLVKQFDPLGTAERNSFANSMSLLGYPHKTRNVAISNGSGNSLNQGFVAGANLLHWEWSPWWCLNAKVIDLRAWSLPGNNGPTSNGNIFIGKMPLSQVTVGICALGLVSCNPCINANVGFLNQTISYVGNNVPLDNCPGGFRNVALDFKEQIASDPDFLGSIDCNGGPNCANSQTFIPTISALDLNTTDFFYSVNTNPSFLLTPFKRFFAPTNNQKHVFADNSPGGNLEWGLKEILQSANSLITPLNSLSLNNGIYNYGRRESHYLPNITVESGGVLYVNANLPTDYGITTNPAIPDGSPVPDPGSTFELETYECTDFVEIKNGGQLFLGDNSTSNKAIVTIHSGVNFYLRSGSHLIINDNSKLIIEEGATLTLEPGATIELRGPDALFDVRGFLNTVTLNSGEHLNIIRNSNLHGGTIQFTDGLFEMNTGSFLNVDDCKVLFNDVVLNYQHDATFVLNDERALVDIKQPCTININNGERFPVLKGTASTGGTLQLMEGDFNLNIGGMILSENCKIKLEKYNFHYYENADITLNGEESMVQIGEFIYLHTNALFTFNGNGYLSFKLSPNLGTYTNIFGDATNSIEITGNGPTDKIVEVISSQLNTSDAISFFKLQDGLVMLQSGGSIAIGNPYVFKGLEVSSSKSYGGKGVVVGGQTSHYINDVTFRNQQTAFKAYLYWTNGSPLSLSDCRFIDCYEGIVVFDKSIQVSNSSFNNVNIGITGSIMAWPSSIFNCSFNSVGPGVKYSSDGNSSLNAAYNSFLEETTGFDYSGKNLLSLKCNNFRGWYAAEVRLDATFNVSPLVAPAGYNDLKARGIAGQGNIECDNISMLLLENGHNDFSTSDGFTFHGHVYNSHNNSAAGTANKWQLNNLNDPNIPKNYDLKCGPLNPAPKTMTLIDKAPATGECGIISDDNSDERSSPLLWCPDCPLVNSTPMNVALRNAISITRLANGENEGDDLLAADALIQIVAVGLGIESEMTNWLRELAYVKLKETIAHGMLSGVITLEETNPYIQSLINVENAMIINARRRDDDTEEFFCTIDLAGVYRAIGNRTEAINILNGLTSCLNISEEMLNYYHKIIEQYTAEDMVINGTMHIQEFDSYLSNSMRQSFTFKNARANIDTIIIDTIPFSSIGAVTSILDANGYSYSVSNVSGTSSDFMLTKHDTNYQIIWEELFNGINNGPDSVVSIAKDNNDYLYITGKMWNGYDYDLATMKYDTAGNKYWTALYNNPEIGNDQPYSVTIDSAFNVTVTGIMFNDSIEKYFKIIYSQCDTNCGVLNRSMHQFPVNSKKESALGLNVSPNPSNGLFTIYIEDELQEQHYTLLLFDITGRIVSKGNVENRANLNFQSLSKGIYYLEVLGRKGSQSKKVKIVIH